MDEAEPGDETDRSAEPRLEPTRGPELLPLVRNLSVSLIPTPQAPGKLSLDAQSEWRVNVESTLAVAAGSHLPGSHSSSGPYELCVDQGLGASVMWVWDEVWVCFSFLLGGHG